MRRLAVAVLVLLAGACGDDDEPPAATSTSTTRPTSAAPTSTTATSVPWPPPLRLEQVAPVRGALALTTCADDDRLFVATKDGRVVTLPGEELAVDLRGEVSTGGEQGLLGVACDPDGERLYLSYTDRDGDTRLDVLDRRTNERRQLFGYDQPASNHNGGNILFGSDGKLWLGLGDGGGSGDTFGNAQDPSDPLGDLVRFDVEAHEPQPELVASGLRNPWRFSFDRETGDLWIGDVGQGEVEEIDLLPAGRIEGANLGWPALEGTRPFRGDPPAGAVPPVFEYGRSEGQSVVGGYVYRGRSIPGLAGTYLFADTYTARIRALRVEGNRVIEHRDLELPVPGGLVASFGEDPAGELYILSGAGAVYKIVPVAE